MKKRKFHKNASDSVTLYSMIIVGFVIFSGSLMTYVYTDISPAATNPAYHSPIYGRTVNARIYQTYPAGNTTYLWTVPNETASQVGQALAQMRPTFVEGLIRVDHNAIILPSSVIANYTLIRKDVLAASPKAKFDIVLRGEEYSSGAEISSDMQLLSTELKFNIFFIDSSSSDSNSTLQAAIAEAHSLGKLIGFDGPSENQNITGVNFIASTIPSVLPLNSSDLTTVLEPDGNLSASLFHYYKSLGLPLILHGDNFSPDRQTFAQNFTQAQRSRWITRASKMQKNNSYALEYPVFGVIQAPINADYNSITDGTLALQVSLINANNIKD